MQKLETAVEGGDRVILSIARQRQQLLLIMLIYARLPAHRKKQQKTKNFTTNLKRLLSF